MVLNAVARANNSFNPIFLRLSINRLIAMFPVTFSPFHSDFLMTHAPISCPLIVHVISHHAHFWFLLIKIPLSACFANRVNRVVVAIGRQSVF